MRFSNLDPVVRYRVYIISGRYGKNLPDFDTGKVWIY